MAEKALAKAEGLALRRKTTHAEARDAAASTVRASQDAALETAHALKAPRHARAEGAKRARGEHDVATSPAPPVTSTAIATRPAPR